MRWYLINRYDIYLSVKTNFKNLSVPLKYTQVVRVNQKYHKIQLGLNVHACNLDFREDCEFETDLGYTVRLWWENRKKGRCSLFSSQLEHFSGQQADELKRLQASCGDKCW